MKTYKVESSACKNSLGMDITVFRVVCDGITYAETRFSDVAAFVANKLTERDHINAPQGQE